MRLKTGAIQDSADELTNWIHLAKSEICRIDRSSIIYHFDPSIEGCKHKKRVTYPMTPLNYLFNLAQTNLFYSRESLPVARPW